MRSVNNTLFEATISLSAFSLTDLSITDMASLITPWAHFVFFLIVVFWVELPRVYAAVPVRSETLDFDDVASFTGFWRSSHLQPSL
ncbi:hypothetical protein GWM83_00795 [Candidatus Bathyarchaeota archaeon]|nr:hypothetical protein [Candidatus Bathyarchaeota archaeon]